MTAAARARDADSPPRERASGICALGGAPRPRLRLTLAATLFLVAAAGAPAPVAAGPLRWTADLDGNYLALGPLGAATRVENAWDGAFGAEASLFHVSEHRRISAIGLAFGGMRFSEREGGRLWAEGLFATRRPFDLAIGLSLGAVTEVDDVSPPRWGAQAGIWVFAGVIPYFRVGTIQRSGVFIDFGLKIALPTFRW